MYLHAEAAADFYHSPSEWQPIRGRELVGLVPWMFGMPDNVEKYNQAWKHLIDTTKLRGSNGMRTNEPSYQYYMRQYRYEGSNRECQWNGPVWPYQTTQVLLGMANLLNSYTQSIIGKADYLYEIRSYIRLHYNGNLLNLQEDYEPDKTGAIVGLARSPHYFHSGYIDLIISGLVGIRPRADNTLEINPLIPAGSDISYFRLQDITYHGNSIAIEWDSTGSRYGRGAGLKVEVDGVVVVSAATIQRLTATITKGTPPAIIRNNITKSTQLYRDQYPKGSASSGTAAENLHDAIDGRTWFFPELPNGWNSDAQSVDSTQWYTIDFGTSTSLSGCTLAFYDDGATFIAPPTYDILQLVNGAWVKIYGYGETLLANGITNVQWSAVNTNQLRVAFPQKAGKRVRLVEFKAF